MKISTLLEYAGGFRKSVEFVAELESAGLDLVWVGEAYGIDAPTQMGYLAAKTSRVEIGSAILPIFTRTPTLLAMTAAGVDALSEGRAHLGIGASGPQVVEGWHGVRYEAPLARTREIVDICRAVWARQAPLTYSGSKYILPLPPELGTGLGKPLKIIARPIRDRVPIWLAALGARNVELAAEVADGWLPLFFIPEKAKQVWGEALAAGAGRRDPALAGLQISAGGLLAVGEGPDVLAVRDLARSEAALYIGGMGAKGKNFYNDLAVRYGYEREAAQIQELYLSGRKSEAEAAVPDEFLELTTLVGPRAFVVERVAALREAGVTHLQVKPVAVGSTDAVHQIAALKDIVG
jgi:F420-dependent oxidoreductase-like protein